MDRYHREPTLAEVLSDPVTLAVWLLIALILKNYQQR
jgi:hypothetical protein